MVVPYGFGVGDIVAVGTIAWNVYKACRAAPESFSNISLEVLSLHAILKEAEETVFKSPLPTESQKRLTTVGDGCRSVLDDLQKLVDRYESLGTQSKKTWDRMKWGAQDIAEIRQRLISNTTMLTAFISISQPSVELKLDKFMRDVCDGRREPSIASRQTVDSLTPNDKEWWRAIRKELEDIGITKGAFDANKDFIFSWFTNAVASGAFQEEEPPSPSESMYLSGTRSPVISSYSFRVDESDAQDVSGDIGLPNIAENQQKEIEPATDKRAVAASNSTRHISRIAILLASLSRPNRRFSAAVRADDLLEVRRILKDPTSRHALNESTLYTELRYAIRFGHEDLIKPMIDAGAPVNPFNAMAGYLSPLMIAVDGRDHSTVRYLLENGADVNYQASKEEYTSHALRCAIRNKSEIMVSLLLAYGADVNAKRTSRDDCVAIHQALDIGFIPIVCLLLDHEANIEADCFSHSTSIMIAIQKNNIQALRHLVEKGVDVNKVSWTGSNARLVAISPLELAASMGSLEMLRILVENGAVLGLQHAQKYARDTTDLSNRIEILRLLGQHMSRF